MNELNINLLHSPGRSLFRRVLGGLYILMGVSWLILRIVSQEPIINIATLRFLDFIYTGFFVLAGIIYIIEGFGISISSWFGQAFIKIDMTSICIKKGIFLKQWKLLWSDIEQVDYKVIKIQFTLTDGSHQELNYDYMAFEHIQEVKRTIHVISREKSIIVIERGS